MTAISRIEWTETTWNPLTGCTKVSSGCKNCYAERMSLRLKAMGQRNYHNGFKLTIHEEVLTAPLRWKKPRLIFVNSMSDLFHDDVPDEFILRLFHIMNQANWHQYQILTKRSRRLLELDKKLTWMENIWMGVSVESQEYQFRIDDLRAIGAGVKFLSIEPLLGPLLNLDIRGIDWVIVGGESGPGARVMDPNWVMDIRDLCCATNTPFFFKQWGGVRKNKNGRELEGRTWDEMPNLIREKSGRYSNQIL